jgi:galactose-1-phosphate uridylyltransferase
MRNLSGHCVEELGETIPSRTVRTITVRDFEDIEEYEHPVFEGLLAMPYHVWFMYKGRHYDVTSPHGVKNFYELSNCAYYIELSDAERKKEFDLLNEQEREFFSEDF